MENFDPFRGLGTLAIHATEEENPYNTNVSPIYQSSIYRFPDVATGAGIFSRETPGYVYSRLNNPTLDQVARKLAVLEGVDLLRKDPRKPIDEVVQGKVFASGMAAITTAVLSKVPKGGVVIAQEALYSRTHTFLHEADRYGFRVVWLTNPTLEDWEKAFAAESQAVLAYVESPVNPGMAVLDIAAIVEIAHRHNAWAMVDNTFATPYCQRPLTLGADLVVHSTTKYLNGHGLIIGGALISQHVDFMQNEVFETIQTLGPTSSPFDTWLLNNGLKTFEIRMERHCSSAMKIAHFLEQHPAVEKVNYPGLESFPYYEIAKKQMMAYGGMMSFELKGGYEAGEWMMNHVRLCRLAVSLGHLDTLIEHPASMTHSRVDPVVRAKSGITPGLVRFSVGIENVEDIIADLDQSMKMG